MVMTSPCYEQAKWSLIPEHMRSAMKDYIENGVTPGGFLTAVLSNDLKDAIARADDVNKYRLPEYMEFLVWYLPAIAWGSTEAVATWTGHGGMNGYEEDDDRGKTSPDQEKAQPF